VLNVVRMVRASCLEKLLKLTGGLPCLALEIELSNGDVLLIGVGGLLVGVDLIAASSDRNLLGSPLRPPLIAFDSPLCALVGRFSVALDENGLNHLLTGRVVGGDVEQLLRGLWLVTTELIHKDSVVHSGLERLDDVGTTDLGQLVTLLGETPDVNLQGFALLLLATLQIIRVAWPHVCALKVADGDLIEILPAIDQVFRQMIESGPS
jgi:hypothetical protein